MEILKNTTLEQVYPMPKSDLLGNRHNLTLTRISKKFQNLYNKNKPTKYIISKGICQFQHPLSQLEVSMTIENGSVIGIKSTSPKQNVYVNYNRWEEESECLQIQTTQKEQMSQQHEFQNQQIGEYSDELIMDYEGKILQNVKLSAKTELMSIYLSQIYKAAVEDISLSKINGAVIYINNTLPQSCFYEQQALIYAFFVSILQVNNILEDYTTQDIIRKIRQWGSQSKYPQCDKLSRYEKIFSYKHNSIKINHNDYLFNQVDKNSDFDERYKKFIVFKLPEHIKGCFSKSKISNCELELLKNQNQQVKPLSLWLKQQQGLHNDTDIEAKYVAYVLSENKRKLQELIKINKVESGQFIMNMLMSIAKYLPYIQGFFYNQTSKFFIFSARKCAQIIGTLSKEINKYRAKDESNGKDILECVMGKYKEKINKWGRNKKVGEEIFSTVPSVGISVLDLKEQIWLEA